MCVIVDCEHYVILNFTNFHKYYMTSVSSATALIVGLIELHQTCCDTNTIAQ